MKLTEGEKKRRAGISKSMKGTKNAQKGKLSKTKHFAGISVDPDQLKKLNENYKKSGENCRTDFLVNLGINWELNKWGSDIDAGGTCKHEYKFYVPGLEKCCNCGDVKNKS